MDVRGWGEILVTIAITVALGIPLGAYLARVWQGGRTWLDPVLQPIEGVLYAAFGVDRSKSQSWFAYAISMLFFSAASFLVLYLILRFQDVLPFNPQGLPALPPELALNTAISFVTNTNWQFYSGETTMSYLSQMAGLTVHNFVSAATGIALAMAIIRGFSRKSSKTVGNFWVDLTRCTLYILMPIAIVYALFLIWQGVPQTLGAYVDAATLDGAKQTIAVGPVASQEAIKMLGTNGGGFFNGNSAHPFENPTALSNLIQMISIFSIGAALTNVFGRMVGRERQGWALFGVMGLLFLAGTFIVYPVEAGGNPAIAALGVDQSAGPLQPGGNMEGKEARFGIGASAVFATVTTATSCGAVNSAHDSFTPLGGFVPLFQMQLGEVVFGGVGTGLYSMLVFAIIGVFIAGLMIGRTPEYLGKKIEAFEMKMSSIAILVMPFIVLVGTAVAVSATAGKAGVANPAAHGFSEILYAFTSAGNNNGSAFAGISANTVFYNTALGLVMWVGRYWPIVAVLAIAGSLAAKKRVPVTAGTMPTHGPTFVILLIGTVLLVGVLTFVPALALGPVVEHLTLWAH